MWGGVIAVKPDGSLREVVPGNGMITPFGIAFSPCGDLASANDDGGMMALTNQAGEVGWFISYLSFIPPMPFIAFAPNGSLYASEGEPMPNMPKQVLGITPQGITSSFIKAEFPSGLAYSPDGMLYVSETTAGRIIRVSSEKETEIIAQGLKFPQGLALDDQKNLYAVTGPDGFSPNLGVSPAPINGDKILRIDPKGEVSTVLKIAGITDIAVSPQGELFATTGGVHADGSPGRVIRINADGSTTTIARGFEQPTGLAFDMAGYLYVADAALNGVVRIAGFPQGMLSGQVLDGSGNPIEGARLKVYSVDPITVGQIVFSSADGTFSLPAAPRNYTIQVTAEGFEPWLIEDVIVDPAEDTSIEIRF